MRRAGRCQFGVFHGQFQLRPTVYKHRILPLRRGRRSGDRRPMMPKDTMPPAACVATGESLLVAIRQNAGETIGRLAALAGVAQHLRGGCWDNETDRAVRPTSPTRFGDNVPRGRVTRPEGSRD
jgi:hypothetical protein